MDLPFRINFFQQRRKLKGYEPQTISKQRNVGYNEKKTIRMNKLYFLLFTFSLFSYGQNKKTERYNVKQKEIEVVTNKTIETFMILRSLSDSDPLFKYRKADYKAKPLIYAAREYFKNFKNDTAVKNTQEILAKTSVTGDLILQGLLYSDELPKTNLKYGLNSYWKKKEPELKAYLKVLKHFYDTANVEDFLKKYRDFYQGAIIEATSHLDKNLIPVMETYFGQSNPHYNLIIIPISPFGMGFGANVGAGKSKILYQIISPASDIHWSENLTDYKEFGYSGKGSDDYYRDLVAHEFCHSFITPIIKQKKYQERINQTDSLYVPELDSIMEKQSYGSWWGFVNEHMVRVASIRISKKLDIKDLEEMRKDNVVDKGFILIPDAEKLLGEYENNREKYPIFEKFLPKLINKFKNYTRKDIEEKIRFRKELKFE